MMNIRPDLVWNLALLSATKYKIFLVQKNSQTSKFSGNKTL